MPSPQQSRPRDEDPVETGEWLDSLAAVIQQSGAERGQFLLSQLADALRQIGGADSTQQFSAYRNTIALQRQGAYPGDLAIERARHGDAREPGLRRSWRPYRELRLRR
jgi:pyruvate dehydrogenase E1 component